MRVGGGNSHPMVAEIPGAAAFFAPPGELQSQELGGSR